MLLLAEKPLCHDKPNMLVWFFTVDFALTTETLLSVKQMI